MARFLAGLSSSRAPRPRRKRVALVSAKRSPTQPSSSWGGALDSQVEVFSLFQSIASGNLREQEQIGRAAHAARPICSCSVWGGVARQTDGRCLQKTSTCESVGHCTRRLLRNPV